MICLKCMRKGKTIATGVPVITLIDVPARPYEIRWGDVQECPYCGHRAVDESTCGDSFFAGHEQFDAYVRAALYRNATYSGIPYVLQYTQAQPVQWDWVAWLHDHSGYVPPDLPVQSK